MSRSIFLLGLLVFNSKASANDNFASFAAGVSGLQSGSTRSLSLMGGRFFPIAYEGRARIGIGARYTNVQRENRLDLGESRAFEASKISLHAFNAVFLAEMGFYEDFAIGMNVDLIGGSLGEEVDLIGTNSKTKPQLTNVLLGGRNDKGSLNSEFFVAYKFNDFRLATGLSHQTTEFQAVSGSTEKLQRFYDNFFLRLDYFF